MPEYLSPVDIRLSRSILLSDLMGCDSVYRYGYSNKVMPLDSPKLREARELAENLLQPVIDQWGPVSFTYGYICPRLSRAIVKYQDPDKPSYHRWDLGAAADTVIHSRVNEDVPPAVIAWDIDERFEYARMITYAESEGICLATSTREGDRGAFYENRYMGKGRKPKFIRQPQNRTRGVYPKDIQDVIGNWRGEGYPHYHGGGRKQYHHHRVSLYTLLSDYLYHDVRVETAKKNNPSFTPAFNANILRAGNVIDGICEFLNDRVSIVRAYASHEHKDKGPVRDFEKQFIVDLKLPEGSDVGKVVELVFGHPHVESAGAENNGTIRITGKEYQPRVKRTRRKR